MLDEQRIKVHVLTVNSTKIKPVQERVCKMHPVDMTCFYDFNDFFASSKENPPDILALSMNYQHSGVAEFPQILQSKIGCPVIIFLEVDNSKGRTVISACEAQYKITSQVTAHNLWMKIHHCLDSEAKAQKVANKKNKSGLKNPVNNERNDDIPLKADDKTKIKDIAYLLKNSQRDEEDKKGPIKKSNDLANGPIKTESERIEEEKCEEALLTHSHKVIRDIISLNSDYNEKQVIPTDSNTLEMMTVQINKSKGCLMIAPRSDEKLPDKWFGEFRKELLHSLEASGFKSEISPYLSTISKEFSDRVSSRDKFSGKNQTESPNFLFAEYNYEEPFLVTCKEAGYLEVDLKMIKPEKVLYFDVYIYLPKNNKSVRYLKKGDAMSFQQADRLDQNPNTDKLYIDPKEELQLRQFLLEVSFEKHIVDDNGIEQSQDQSSDNNSKPFMDVADFSKKAS